MKSREEVIAGLRSINAEYDDPTLTKLEVNNMDAGAMMLLWVLDATHIMEFALMTGSHVDHAMIRAEVMRVLLEEDAKGAV